MNILVTGAHGQLGQSLKEVAQTATDHYIFTDVCYGYDHLDITHLEQIRQKVRADKVQCIVNCAAWTDVDGAESAGPIVEHLNSTGPKHLAQVMKEAGGLLIHISTDYVFGAESYNTPCREEQAGTPSGVYGSTKLLAEQHIAASGADFIIIRTAWLYSEYGRNFVKTMLSLTASKPEIKVVFDQCGTPTYALDLAKVIWQIIEQRLYDGHLGIYNYSNEGVCSWYDFAMAINSLAGHHCKIVPCHSNEFPSPVTRPPYSVLDKTKIKQTFGIDIPYWTDSLRQCLAHISEHTL